MQIWLSRFISFLNETWSFVTSSAGLALIAFLWYRRGRLWKFYYTLLSEATQQSETASIDRPAWEVLAYKHVTALATDFFGALFQFELEYLRDLIKETPRKFWSADSSGSSYPSIDKDLNAVQVHETETIWDKALFTNTTMRALFFKKLRFFGIGLFIMSVLHMFKKKPTGIDRTRGETPIRGFLDRKASVEESD